MEHNNNRLLLVAAWSHYSIMRCLSEKPTLEYCELENTLRNKISCGKPYLSLCNSSRDSLELS